MRIVGNDPTLSRQTTATASGAISAAGKPLIVNTDGTVSVVSSSPDVLGDETTVYSGDFQAANAVYDEGQDKVLFMYRGASNYGYAVVGTVSGNSISFGTPTAFISSAASYFSSTYDPDNAKTAIFFTDNGDSSKNKAVVATISGTSVSFGSATVFPDGVTNNSPVKDSTYDTSQDKILVVYSKGQNAPYANSTEAVAATISGTSISFGGETQLDSDTCAEIGVAYDANAGKSLMIYRKASTAKIESQVLSLSGSTVSAGTETNLYNAAGDKLGITYDSTAQKLVAFYRHDSGTTHTKFVVATISGTSVSYGTPVDTGIDFNGTPRNNSIHHNVAANKIVYIGRDGGNSYIIKYIIATVSGTSITIDNTVTVYGESNDSYLSCNVYDPDQQKSVLFYADGTAGAFKNPIARVLTVGTGDNLTTENFIGTSAHVAADGAKVLVNTQGAIDENQSGLTAGQTFFVDKNGALQLTTNVSASLGSSSTTIPASSSTGIGYASGTFDSSNGKVVVTFQDQGDGTNKAKARVGTVDTSDNSISFGTIAIANNAATNYPFATFDSNSNKVVVLYADDGNSGHGTGVVGTVSGTDISFGSGTVFESANTYYISATFDSSNNKVVVAYNDGGNSGYGTAVVGTVSGTSISFGTPVVFESANAGFESIVFDSSNNKVVIAYRDDGNSYYGTAIVGTVSGTSISFGSAAVYHSTNAIANMIAFDSTNNKVVIAYKDNSDSQKGKAVVGTVSGTSISFGSPAVFEAGAIVTSGNTGIGIVYDSNAEKIVIHYEDSGDSNYSKLIVGTVSGTSISFAGELTTYAGNTVYQNAIFDSTNNRVVTVLNNFAKVYSNAQDLSGSLSHDAVPAGTALSATKLLVKG